MSPEVQDLIKIIIPAILGWLLSTVKSSKIIKNLRADRNNLAAALAYREGELLPPIHPKDQEEIDNVMDSLMSSSGVDRIATMWACNGATAPTETTSISVKNRSGRHEEYYRTALDPVYVTYLLAAEKNGYHVIDASQIPTSSQLYGLYKDLGIAQIMIIPLYYEINTKYNIRGWLYMTCARYYDIPFSPSEIRAILAACALKGAIYQKAKINAGE